MDKEQKLRNKYPIHALFIFNVELFTQEMQIRWEIIRCYVKYYI